MLVTFALLCHNQELFVRDAVRAALAQTYEPLEILISDDHSTDATFGIIQEEIRGYAGPHSIRLIRQTRNLGFENWFHTAEAAKGEFVVCAHGDDISYPGRTSCLVEAWQQTNASLLSSNAEIIDANSRLLSFLNNTNNEPKWISATEIARFGFRPTMHGATLAWHPDVFRNFEPLNKLRLGAAYDHVLPFRAAVLNGSYYVAHPHVRWRVHGKNAGIQNSDLTRGPLVQKETGSAYALGARICMLDDLDYLIKRGGNKDNFHELRELLIAQIISLARSLTFHRNELMAAGSRPTWITQAEIEGRVDYSKGYFDESEIGLRSIPKKARRSLARIVKSCMKVVRLLTN